MNNQALHEIADRLDEASTTRRPIESISKDHPEFDLKSAYQVQLINANRAMKEGKRVVGYKVGLTSAAAQRSVNLPHPDFGHLFQSMAVADEGEVDLGRLIQPKIEGEIAFVMGKELKGPVTVVDALSAIDYALVCMEIVDSRIENWKITAVDTIADNGSSALFVLGTRKCSLNTDFASKGMALSKNGEVWLTGSGAAVMGNPLTALTFLANELEKIGKSLLPGEVVLSGSLSHLVPMAAGDHYVCEIGGMGRCSVRVKR